MNKVNYLLQIAIFSLLLSACQPTISNLSPNPTPVPSMTTDVTSQQVGNPEIESNSPANQLGRYQPYSAELASTASQEGPVVLFFHAKWCPTCRAADADINANLDQIPASITILKADYDTETELKEKYSIVSQHTFVIIDSEENEVAKWNGGNLRDILEKISS
jgi:thiol-disulfide isomerase/thioredoxin